MIISTDSPRSHWPLGKVIEVYPGRDGHVRSVKRRKTIGETYSETLSAGTGPIRILSLFIQRFL